MNSMQKHMDNSRKIGHYYETVAKRYIEEQGYTIIVQNFYSRFGEIDLIARDDEYIIFLEVKYRKTHQYGYPREAVTYSKRQKILKTAHYFISMYFKEEPACRFDVIEILGDEIRHLKAVF